MYKGDPQTVSAQSPGRRILFQNKNKEFLHVELVFPLYKAFSNRNPILAQYYLERPKSAIFSTAASLSALDRRMFYQ